VKESEIGDRQLDALLERLDKLNAEVRALNRRLDSGEHLVSGRAARPGGSAHISPDPP
jgi:hypothetical protein